MTLVTCGALYEKTKFVFKKMYFKISFYSLICFSCTEHQKCYFHENLYICRKPYMFMSIFCSIFFEMFYILFFNLPRSYKLWSRCELPYKMTYVVMCENNNKIGAKITEHHKCHLVTIFFWSHLF